MRVNLGAHDEHVLERAALDHRARGGEGMEKARTLVADVERGTNSAFRPSQNPSFCCR